MRYVETIVCLANSRKNAGRCVAGKEWQDGKPGEWVRPVSERQTHELSKRERRYVNGRDPELLDVISVPCERRDPMSHQRENHVIDPSRYWVKKGRLAWQDIQNWLDNPATLWSLRERSYTGFNNRVRIGQEDGTSLYLVAVERLRLLVGCKAPGFLDFRRAVRGEFVYRSVKYRMDVTDPVIEMDYSSKPDGSYDVLRPVLCVSLGDDYRGYFYKLIAAVLYPERFK